MRLPPKPGTVDRGHVIRLDPTVKQADFLARACGVSRFTYNWALAAWKQAYANGERPTASALKKAWNAIKGIQFPWVAESPRDANSQPFADLGRAFSNFFKSCKGQRKGKRVGHPTFRRRGVDDSFYVANDKFSLRARGKRGAVRLPVIGDVKMFERLRFQGKILSGRVFRKAGQWFLAVACEAWIERPAPLKDRNEILGVDLGLKTSVVTSQGEFLEGPKPLRNALRRLRRANRRLHRRRKGGRNREKARLQVAKIHQRIVNIRKDFWHKITTRLVRENQAIVVEDLSIGFMNRNRRTSRAAADVAPGMFRPLLRYKAVDHGTEIVETDRLFPSTQRCSRCGNIRTGEDKVVLGVPVYRCDACGLRIDRDLNASYNLEKYPGLQGNWIRKDRTPGEAAASTRRTKVRRASAADDPGTRP